MISRSKKKVDEPESDSDWDSLPGDVPEPSSSPETKVPTMQAQSLSPIPPKQPNTHSSGRTPNASKPLNIYKNTANSSRKAATTFEDRSGGQWSDDDNDNDAGIRFHQSKEQNNNNQGNGSKVLKEKKEKRHVQEQELQKRPPFTDFKDALSSPIPPSQSRKEARELSGVNQAYRVDKGDEIHRVNHDSWDDSDNDIVPQLQHSHTQGYQRETDVEVKHQHISSRNSEPKQGTRRNKQDTGKIVSKPIHLASDQHHFDVSRTDFGQFENCCLIQVNHGPFDERYRPSFFHGSKNHFHIREDDPRASVTDIADKSEVIFQRFWREVFGVLQIVMNFFIIFILELFKVIIHSLRYLISGILYTMGDHLTKPLLSAVFNNIIQPFSILLLNMFTIVKNLLKPVLEFTRELLTQISIPLKAFRLFEVNWKYKGKDDNSCTDIKVI